MSDQRPLELERRHPDAGYLEHVVAAAAEGVASVGVANVFVAGAGPVALVCPAALAALIPVAFAGRGSIDQEFANLSIGHVGAGFVDEPHLVARHRTPRRAVFDIARPLREKNMQEFGRADAVENIDAEARLPAVADRLRQRLARGGADSQA